MKTCKFTFGELKTKLHYYDIAVSEKEFENLTYADALEVVKMAEKACVLREKAYKLISKKQPKKE